MKTVQIIRGKSTDEGTFSVFRFGDVSIWCVELPWYNNASGKSCIPTGVYQCAIIDSPKHGRVYEVQAVPGRSMIEIHIANFGGDTSKGYACELLGCIAPSMSVGYLNNSLGASQRAGLSSKSAFQMFMQWANNDPLELTISQAP